MSYESRMAQAITYLRTVEYNVSRAQNSQTLKQAGELLTEAWFNLGWAIEAVTGKLPNQERGKDTQ